jgi:valyl-tRNA synthetase
MRERLEREQKKLESEVDRGRKKLANEAFVQKASAEAVSAEREKLAGYEAALERTHAALRELNNSL